ncbi:uncharacterized protein TNCV_2002891 [Trichonephila clavipes]|nr:uncharacterized protein TNCV_2002891 [Trichonephila clavipes]
MPSFTSRIMPDHALKANTSGFYGDFTREHEAVEKDYILIEHMSNSFPSDFYNESFKNLPNNVNLFPRSVTSLVISDVDTNHDLTEVINIDCKETDEDNKQNHEPENNSKGQMLIKAMTNPTTLPFNYKLVDKSMDNFQPEKESNSCNETLNIANELMNNFSIIENHHQRNLNLGKDDEITEYHPLMNENKQINEYEFRIQIENQQFNSHPNNQANKQQQILKHDSRKCINNEYSAITCKNKRINPSEFKRCDFKQETGSNRIPRLGERIETFIESANEETDSVEINVKLRSLIQLQKNAEELRNNYYAIPNVKDAELTAVDEDLHLLEVRLESLEVRIETILNSSKKSSSGAVMKTNDNFEIKTKIPPLVLPEFSGKYEEFSSFKIQFDDLITNNILLSEPQKLYSTSDLV